MTRFFAFSFILTAAVLIFISCNEAPTSIGSNLIPDNNKINFIQLDSYDANLSQKSGYYEEKLKLGISDRILLGKISYAESYAYYKYTFSIADSLTTGLKNGDVFVEKAWMQLKPIYTIGDKSSSFDFTAHQIRSDWNRKGFDRDSVSSLQYDGADVAANISVTDTLIQFYISSSVVTEWLKRSYDTLNYPKNYGLLLKPKSSTKKILGFNSAVIYPSANQSLLFLVLTKTGKYKDTLAFAPFSDLHSLTSTLPSAGSNFYLQGGYSLRGNLFFDLNALPKNIIINKATLQLTVDTLKSLDGSLSTDSIYVQMFADSTTRKLTGDSTTVLVLARSGNIFSGDITYVLQRWENGLANNGIKLALWDEYSSAARIAFYGSKNSDRALRPKLKIIYMQKQ